MAMLRLDVPGLVLYSGAMSAGVYRGAPVTILEVWEAVGAHESGAISDEELDALERVACPGFGACTGHFTANTMATAVDFLGLGPIGLGSIPATDPAKAEAGRAAGRLALDVLERGVLPSSLVTRDALENAIVGVAGTGGSTNGVLHLLAIADEAGVELGLDDFDRLSAATPVVTSLSPGGRYVAGDLHRVGGSAAVIKQLLAHLHGDAQTVDGRTLAEHAAGAADPDGDVIAPASRPFKEAGALRILRGNLAPDGAVVKVAGHERPVHRGPARVFDSEAACKAAVYDGFVRPGDVVVVRNEGPAGAPGMPPAAPTSCMCHCRGRGDAGGMFGRGGGRAAPALYRASRGWTYA
jgi:dihydroxy-acid dehydratase